MATEFPYNMQSLKVPIAVVLFLLVEVGAMMFFMEDRVDAKISARQVHPKTVEIMDRELSQHYSHSHQDVMTKKDFDLLMLEIDHLKDGQRRILDRYR
jgi:hypothetical protein